MLLAAVVAAAGLGVYWDVRQGDPARDAANGGGPGDGARDVTGSHPLPNETAAPKPASHGGVAPGR